MFYSKIFLFILICTSFCRYTDGQVKYYGQPLAIPLSLSGNFGELRPNHFHTGLDFRTQQRTGLPVLSSAEGNITRIVVSPAGYGKVMYVDHPNGTTTVYGHLDRFREDIEEYVKDQQYENNSFAVDLKIAFGKFPVEKGEQIAKSGNSGSSGGPHLHYEIRDTRTQDAINPLIINDFNVKDKTPPKIFSVRLYPLDENSHVNMGHFPVTFQVKLTGKDYRLVTESPVKAFGRIGIAVRANDYFDNNASPCGIYSARLTVNGSELFSYKLERISFDQNRYLNSHIDYAEYSKNDIRYQRLWKERGNRLNIYETDRSRGTLKIDGEEMSDCVILINDVAGNQSALTFRIAGKEPVTAQQVRKTGEIFSYDSRNSFSTDNFEIHAPNGVFYEDFLFKFSVTPKQPGYCSAIYHIHDNSIPFHKPLKISLLTEGLPGRFRDKALIVGVEPDGRKNYVGGKPDGDRMEGNITRFGNYAVVCDTTPPRIVSLGIKNNALTETNAIRFRISDTLSGIGSYEGWIDNEWVLFEYDPKSATLVYFIDRKRLATGKRHSLKLTVTDRVQNVAVYKATFWK